MRQQFTETKIIFHVDVNSAFLSWSAVKKLKDDPEALDLRTVPSVICGDVETRHGIVTAKSIPAKKYGIKTAEPVMSALRKCPNLILEKSDFQTYREYSRRFMEILRSHSDLVEQASIDEAYMDVSTVVQKSVLPDGVIEESAVNFARKIKNEIRDTLGFTVNIGISTNKLLAKTASDFTKPDKIHTLWEQEVPLKMWPLEIGDLFGCGGATASRLRSFGIHTIGDAAHEDIRTLQALLGEKAGEYIWCSANGIGSDEVHTESEDAKSYSNETTLAHDITAENFWEEVPQILEELAASVSRRLMRDKVFAQTIGIMVKTDRFRRLSRQIQLESSSNEPKVLYTQAYQMLKKLAFGNTRIQSIGEAEKNAQGALSGDEYRVAMAEPGSLFSMGEGIRLIGISAAKLDHGEYRQVSLFDYMDEVERVERKEKIVAQKKRAEDERNHRIEDMLRSIRTKYGDSSVSKGSDIIGV